MNLEQLQEGFLGGEAEGYAELLKAMQAGQITGRDTTNLSLTQEPLKVESLEKTLKLLEFRQKDIRLLNAMPKMTAYNTVEEFLQLSSYGNDRGGFYNEGELSDVEDSTYVRRSELIKYLQVTGEVTLQAQMVRSYVDAMSQEVKNKVMWITRKANKAMTSGNSSLVPQEWNGIYAQHQSVGVSDGALFQTLEDYFSSEIVYDLRGASLKQEDVEKAAVIVDANFGDVSHLFAPPSVTSALSQDFFGDQRIMMNANSAGGYNGTIGTVAKAIATSMGDVSLEPDKFMKHEFNTGRLLSDSPTSNKAPSAPTAGATPNVTADSLAKFTAGEAGTVYYAVSAINRSGESALTVLPNATTAVTLAAGSAVDIAFTATPSSYAATGFTIYRTKVTAAANAAGQLFYPIFSVSNAEKAAGYDGGAAGLVRDRGRFVPDTEQAFVTSMSDDVLSFKQLAPISKLDLAILAPSNRFITFMFATPQVYAPKKIVRFINCGKVLTS